MNAGQIWAWLGRKCLGKFGSVSHAKKQWTWTTEITWTGYRLNDLIVKRRWYTDHSTIGELWWGDKYLCFTLEDTVRKGKKVQNETAIPSGKYEVVVNFSNRFRKQMPLLLSVPGFEGVRIHSGNTSADTEGCILVGLERGEDTVLRSRDAFNLVFPQIQEWVAKDKLYIQVANLAGKYER